MFKEDLHGLKKYNLNDVMLVKRLEDKFWLIKLKIDLCLKSGIFLGNAFRTHIIDFLALREGGKQNIHFQSTYEIKMGDEVWGGLILKSKTGYFKDISEFDYKALYPNIIRTFNISPETLRNYQEKNSIIALNRIDMKGSEDREIKQFFFSALKQGVFPKICADVLEDREKYEKLKLNAETKEIADILNRKENIVKVIANASYGQLINPRWRYYNDKIGISVR